MKIIMCNFSGYKIPPGHGIMAVARDGRAFNFIDNKSRVLFMTKKNARVIKWTQVYRRVNKKGVNVDITKRKRARKVAKVARPIVGISLDAIAKKRAQQKAAPKASKDAAVKELKEKKSKGKKTSSKGTKPAKTASSAKKVSKKATKGR